MTDFTNLIATVAACKAAFVGAILIGLYLGIRDGLRNQK
jgi:hypothetical protein